MKYSITTLKCCLTTTALLCSATAASAQSNPLYSKGDWVIGVNAARVFTNEEFDSVSAAGSPVPGAALSINDDTTVSFDVSYFVSSRIALNLFGGVPASASLQGEGALAGLALGETDYGPAILSLQYHLPVTDRIDAYAGAGVARLLFLNEQDGAVSNFDVKDAWAPALQVGTRYRIAGNWMANLDVRYVPFDAEITGALGPAPVAAEVEVDPVILNIGVAYRF